MKLFLLVILALGLSVTGTFSQGGAPLSFAQFGAGARPAGMGGAYTVIADDGSAVFYNPAGLAVLGFAYTFGDPDTAE
ncbi:MAG: hypothetical protein ACE5JA_08550, partial [bacterium]